MANLSKLQQKLIKNHKLYFRDFPWRHTQNPYEIMIAEFMLHRTKADQVVPIYGDFITAYPDVYSLANADEDEISKVTKHLGLHWRTTHFIKSAKYIVENYQGEFPDNRTKLLKIPGIGDYVAGAILTVCFNKPEHVVDSNIARFINRYHNLELKGEIRRKRKIVELAIDIFNYKNTRDLLFALLDFTALICKPVKPDCDSCALYQHCAYVSEKKPLLSRKLSQFKNLFR